jgi:hypothetical protein
MPKNWPSRLLGTIGVGALVIGAGLVVAAPASAAPVADVAALRQAITDANGTGPATQIELTPGTTYSLPGAGGCKNDDDNATGDLDVRRSQSLKIFTPDGQPPAVIEMTCEAERVLHVQGIDAGPAGELILRNVVIRNGHAPVATDGGNFGGGVFSSGAVTVENSTFENNSAGDGKAGVAGDPAGGPGGFGGAILAGGLVTIDGSTFTGNRAGAGGNAVEGDAKPCNGGLGGQGGAVLAIAGLTITNSTFTGNSAGAGGNGGDGRCAPNDVVSGSGGFGGSGGAAQCGIALTATVSGQSLGCTGAMTVRASTFSGNASGAGGKGGTGSSGGVGGSGGLGGAILFVGKVKTPASTLLVENSTVDGNSSGIGGAGGDGGNAGNGGRGGLAGAVAAGYADRGEEAQVAKLVHVTVTENGGGGTGGAAGTPDVLGPAAAAAGAPGTAGQNGGGSLAIFDTWTSVSSVVGTSTAGDGPDCWRAATDATGSVSTDADTPSTACGFGSGSTLAFDGFGLGALADNGGPTKTRLPAATSTLVDKLTAVPNQLTTDQRGVSRPQAAGADIGAVELQLIDMTLTKTPSATSVTAGTEVTFTIAAKNTGTSSPRPGVTLDDPNCGTMSAASGDANTNNTLDPGETFTYTCSATPTEPGTFTNTVTATIIDGTGVAINRTASADVTVTAGGSTPPPLAKTGTTNPLPELATGAGLLIGGVVLLLFTRQRRITVRANEK